MFQIYELVINPDEDMAIDAISIVDKPAIQLDWVAMSKQSKVAFSEIDKDKRIIMGPALVPNQPVYRNQGGQEFYIYFSQDTVRQASELYLKNGNQSNVTIEHEKKIDGLTLVESWIVDDPQNDKSNLYMDAMPKGTWMVSMKVDNNEIWSEYVKTGKVKGFSIEGYFAQKGVEMQQEQSLASIEAALNELEAQSILDEVKALLTNNKSYETDMKSFTDYGSGVRNNAKRGIELNEKNGNKCATQTGKIRAQQLSNGEAITLQTVKRMYSYLSRAEPDYDPNDTKACGTISFLLWGGKAGLAWSRNKLREEGEIE